MAATSDIGAQPHLKNSFSSKKIGLGVGVRTWGKEVLCCFLRESFVQKKTNMQCTEIHHGLIPNNKKRRNKLYLEENANDEIKNGTAMS